jgi:hypothetical protein
MMKPMSLPGGWGRAGLCCLTLGLCALWACDSGDADLPSIASEVSREVGAQGGSLRVKGATLAIPAGALDEPVTLSAKNRGKSAEPMTVVKKVVSDLIEFGPEGTKFKKEVELEIELESEEPRAKVYFSREDDPSQFEALPTTNKGKTASAKVKHFSRAFVGVPDDDIMVPDAALPGDAGGSLDASTAGDAGAVANDAGGSSAGDAGAGLDATPAPDAASVLDAEQPGKDGSSPAPDAGRLDAGVADAGAADASAPDSGPSATRINVNSRDGYGVGVNQTWAAFQDGDGPWQQLPPPSKPGSYTFNVQGSRYGVVFVCSDKTNAKSRGTVHYYPSSKLTLDVQAGDACLVGTAPPTYWVTGNLVLPSNNNYYRYGHVNSGTTVAAGAGTYFANVFPANDMQDLIIAASVATDSGLSSLIVWRDLVLNQVLTQDADFIKTGVAPGPSFSITLTNSSATASVDTYYTTRGAKVGLPLRQSATISPSGTIRSMTYASMPTALVRPSDAYLVKASESLTNSTRTLMQRFSSVGDRSIALPASLPAVFSTVKTPYYRPSAMIGDYAGATKYMFRWGSFPTAGVERVFETSVDPAWFGAAGSHTVTFPDFSGVAGFDPIWVLPSQATGQNVNTDAQAHTFATTADGDVSTQVTAFATLQLN